MALTRLTFQAGSESGGSNVGTITLPATGSFNQAAGEFCCVHVKWENIDVTPTIADTAGSTWVTGSRAADTTNSQFSMLFWCLSTSAHASNVITVSIAGGTAQYTMGLAMRYTPGAAVTLVAQATALGTGTVPVTASITAGTVACHGVTNYAGSSSTNAADTNWTEQRDSGATSGGQTFDRIDNPGGSFAPTCTLSGSAAWGIAAASFTDATAGVPELPTLTMAPMRSGGWGRW